MDPQMTLIECARAVLSGDKDILDELLENYSMWRTNGGYEPSLQIMNGDDYFRGLVRLYQNRFGEPYNGPPLPSYERANHG